MFWINWRRTVNNGLHATRRPKNVTYLRVQNNIGHLTLTPTKVDENGTEKTHLFYDIANFVYVHTIADIVRVLYEQENDTGKDLLTARTDEPAQTCGREHRLIGTTQNPDRRHYAPKTNVPAPAMSVDTCAS